MERKEILMLVFLDSRWDYVIVCITIKGTWVLKLSSCCSEDIELASLLSLDSDSVKFLSSRRLMRLWRTLYAKKITSPIAIHMLNRTQVMISNLIMR